MAQNKIVLFTTPSDVGFGVKYKLEKGKLELIN